MRTMTQGRHVDRSNTQRTWKARPTLSALLWLVLLTGMTGTRADDGTPGALCASCSTSFQCGEGLNCISARCKTTDQCCLDQDCPTGQTCQDHHCAAAGAEKIGQCGTCSTSFQCAAGLNCIGARCKTTDQCCLDQDCPAGQTCQDHHCAAAGAEKVGQCGACSTSFQCAAGLNCIGARCKSTDQCCLDQDCPAGQSCQNQQCRN